MRLYHGSNMMIENIDLSKCKPYKDFGRGFYLTEIKEQAEKMAGRTATIQKSPNETNERLIMFGLCQK